MERANSRLPLNNPGCFFSQGITLDGSETSLFCSPLSNECVSGDVGIRIYREPRKMYESVQICVKVCLCIDNKV